MLCRVKMARRAALAALAVRPIPHLAAKERTEPAWAHIAVALAGQASIERLHPGRQATGSCRRAAAEAAGLPRTQAAEAVPTRLAHQATLALFISMALLAATAQREQMGWLRQLMDAAATGVTAAEAAAEAARFMITRTALGVPKSPSFTTLLPATAAQAARAARALPAASSSTTAAPSPNDRVPESGTAQQRREIT